MAEPDGGVWRAVLAHMRANHPDLCRHWFETIDVASFKGGLLVLRTQSDLHAQYLRKQCAEALTGAAQDATGRLVTLRFIGPEDETPQEVAAAPKSAATPPLNGDHAGDADEVALSPDFVFDNFIVGPSNRLAHAAAVGVSERPGEAYNPLFLHGGVGLGKTHLLQAICNKTRERKKDASILFIPCDVFITRFMEAVRAGEMEDFRHRFRDVDLFILDDIHFLAQRERTQEEFFHTFNSLFQHRRQIVLSSDAAPHEIPDMQQRLTSRFQCGLVAKLDPPDYETRGAIVQQKARARGADVPDDVACFIAARFTNNIRELEGALTRVQLQASVDDEPVSLRSAQAALGAAPIPATSKQPTIQTIVDAVTTYFDVSLAHLQSKRRQRSVAEPRQICMYLARRHTRYSLEEIGGYFGGRDHTTVLHAVKAIGAKRQADDSMDQAIQQIQTQLALTPESAGASAV